MFFLAEMPTVISPQHDDGIVGMFALIQGAEHSPDLRVGETDRGEIGLNRFEPLVVRDHVRMIPIRLHRKVPLTGRIVDFPSQLPSKGWDVVQIPIRYLGQFNAIERVQVEMFLRNLPGQMGLS